MRDNGDHSDGTPHDSSHTSEIASRPASTPSVAPYLIASRTMSLLHTRFESPPPGTSVQVELAIQAFSTSARQALITGATLEQLVEVLLSGSFRLARNPDPTSMIIDADHFTGAPSTSSSSHVPSPAIDPSSQDDHQQ